MQPGATAGGFGGAGQWLSDCDVHDVVGRLERVLVAMTADPGRRLSSVDVLGVGERVRLDDLGNKAVLAGPQGVSVSIPDLFAAHVARTSDAVAAMLAVLKTRAAYLLIDPGVPDERVRFVLAGAAPIAAITGTGLAERLDGHDVAVIGVDDPDVVPAVDAQPSTGLPVPAPDDVAYLNLHVGHHGCAQRRCDHPSQRDPAVGAVGCRVAGPGRVGVVPFVGFRRVGVGDFRCAVARGGGAAGRGVRAGDRFTAGLPRCVGRSTGRCAHSNPLGDGGIANRGAGVGGFGGGR